MVGPSACVVFFFQAEDGIRDIGVTGVQTCALPILCLLSAPICAGAESPIRSCAHSAAIRSPRESRGSSSNTPTARTRASISAPVGEEPFRYPLQSPRNVPWPDRRLFESSALPSSLDILSYFWCNRLLNFFHTESGTGSRGR